MFFIINNKIKRNKNNAATSWNVMIKVERKLNTTKKSIVVYTWMENWYGLSLELISSFML